MPTLAGKYGPAAVPPPGAAAMRLKAYARASQAWAELQGGPLVAPALRLSGEQLAALFAPQQLAALVHLPLGRPSHGCGAQGVTGDKN